MGRPAALSRELIVEAAIRLVDELGATALSARRLGEALGCDASALYRHFANMGDLEREVGDRFLGLVDTRRHRNDDWRATTRRICADLRRVQLQHSRFAALVSAAPTRLAHELRITEALLRELSASGLPATAVAAGYHALIELTVGSAAIDAALAAEQPAVRQRHYRDWRAHYVGLDAALNPATVAVAGELYAGTADDRFEFALDLLLDGLAARVPAPDRSPTSAHQ